MNISTKFNYVIAIFLRIYIEYIYSNFIILIQISLPNKSVYLQKMDRITKEQRRKNMQAIKSKGTVIERLMGNALWMRGLRYIKNDKNVIGKPDFVFKRQKVAVFCDGEMWHGKNWKKQKKGFHTHKSFWFNKIENNIKRDKLVNSKLKKEGWIVLRFWGNEILTDVNTCADMVKKALNKNVNIENPITLTKAIDGINYKFRVFGEGSLDKDKETVMPFDEQLAIITHYIHNINRPESVYYRRKALALINDICTTKHAETSGSKKFVLNEDAVVEYGLFKDFYHVPFPSPQKTKFTFIDLFAGIGGFRIAMQNLGGKCVFSSEWDEQAKKTYLANYGEVPFGDITLESTKKFIPDGFDVLCAGFPCQAFSLAGKRLGFEETRGTLFFDVAEIIKRKRPKAFFLENVKGLMIHDKGKTLKTILKVLREDLGYYVPDPKIVNAMYFGVPQHRERIYIVGFRKDLKINDFEYPLQKEVTTCFKDIEEKDTVPTKYYLSTQYYRTLIAHKARHASKGNGFGYEIISDDGVSNAIVVGGMGRERNLVIDNRITDFTPTTKIKGEVNREGIRRMTPREWARLQGYPDDFKIVVADASAYKQFGNSVAVPAIQATAAEVIKRITIIKK